MYLVLTPLVDPDSGDMEAGTILITSRGDAVGFLVDFADNDVRVRTRTRFGCEQGDRFRTNLETLSNAQLFEYVVHVVDRFSTTHNVDCTTPYSQRGSSEEEPLP
jgi:hypothetical protein